MEIKYVALNGKAFDTKEECMQQEGEIIGFKLYDPNGKITYNTDDTAYVYCKDNEALEYLINMESLPYGFCFNFDSHGALTSVAELLWEWNAQQHRYKLVDDVLIEVIKQAL